MVKLQTRNRTLARVLAFTVLLHRLYP